MTEKARKMPNPALRLSAPEWVDLTRRLLAALEGESEADVDRAWAKEAESRTSELEDGSVGPIPWSEVKRADRRRRRV